MTLQSYSMYIHTPILDALRELDQVLYTRSAAKAQVAPTVQDLLDDGWIECGFLVEN